MIKDSVPAPPDIRAAFEKMATPDKIPTGDIVVNAMVVAVLILPFLFVGFVMVTNP